MLGSNAQSSPNSLLHIVEGADFTFPPTRSPSEAGSDCSPGEMVLSGVVTTDNYPSENRWAIEFPGTTREPIRFAFPRDARGVDHVIPPACVPDGATFTLEDIYGDGMCCSYGEGSYSLSLDGGTVEPVAFNPAFGRSAVHTMRLAPTVPTPPPAPPTTAAPTPMGATFAPTRLPTTSGPTAAPTMSEPTSAPTCVDLDDSCSAWAAIGYCVSPDHDVSMAINCRASCTLCTPVEAPPVNPPLPCHKVACGSPDGCGTEEASCIADEDAGSRYGVRCCSDVLLFGWIRNANCPRVASENFGWQLPSECQLGKTWAEANEFCTVTLANLNGNPRLCTVDEAQRGCMTGSGCNLDTELVWTSDSDVIGGETIEGLAIEVTRTTDEPPTEATTAAATTAAATVASNPATSSTDDDDNSKGSSIAGAVLGALGLLFSILIAGLYVRQQRHVKQLEDQIYTNAPVVNRHQSNVVSGFKAPPLMLVAEEAPIEVGARRAKLSVV